MSSEPISIIIEAFPEVSSSILTILSGLLTPAISLIALFIAYQQFKINKNRDKYEKYARRLDVYTKLDMLLTHIEVYASLDHSEVHSFHREVSISSFLFNKKTRSYLKDLYKEMLKFCDLQKKLERIGTEENRKNLTQKEADYLLWFSAQKKLIIDIFKDYFTIN